MVATDNEGLKHYTLGEEIANSVSHGIGIALSIAALVVLVTLAVTHGDVWQVVSFSLYGATLILLYLSSTLYHAIPVPRWKRRLRVLDHVAIFLVIAGSYTPFMLVTLRGSWGWSLFAVVWTIALVGTILKLFFTGRFELVSSLCYIGMGWLVVIAAKPLMAALPTGGLLWLVAGGLCYTGGVAFYRWHRLPYHHAIWHLFVLAGSTCHFFAVVLYVGR